MFRILAVSEVRGTTFDSKIRNKFIEIRYSAPDMFIIFITNDWYFTNFEIIWYQFISENTRQINKVYSFINKRNIDEMSYMINFGINDWT